jgi:hypothetical protein
MTPSTGSPLGGQLTRPSETRAGSAWNLCRDLCRNPEPPVAMKRAAVFLVSWTEPFT